MSILKKENRIVLVTGIICMLIVVLAVNYTYSFFAVEKTNNSVITGEVESMKLSVTVNRVAPTGDSKLIPQQEEVIDLAVTGIQGNCIDGNGNTICHVYKVTLKNEGSSSALVSGTLVLDNKSNPNLKWAQISGLTNPTLIGNKNLPSVTTFVTNEEYQAGASKDYYVVVWINETGASQTDTGNYTGTVTFTTVDANAAGATADRTLENLDITPEIATLTTFNATSKLDGTTGVYAAEDDLGTSYYFRGNVTNNYVKFGRYTEDAYLVIQNDSNIYSYSYANVCPASYTSCTKIASAGNDMYWRIIRINGDGTIRMIYDGVQAFANNDTNKSYSNNSIGLARYNSLGNDNAHVGYMYGTARSNNYEDTHANINDSDLKKVIDAWYAKYLNTTYGQYIADAIYCNDRTRVTNATTNMIFAQLLQAEGVTGVSAPTGEGFNTYSTLYSGYNRVDFTTVTLTPTLKCEQVNDRFTKEDTVSGIEGNSMLDYPVATITIDELVFAGSFIYTDTITENDEMYLYSVNSDYSLMTMSPSCYLFGNEAGSFDMNHGVFALYSSVSSNNSSVHPVISLNANAITGGLGTSGQPFTVS